MKQRIFHSPTKSRISVTIMPFLNLSLDRIASKKSLSKSAIVGKAINLYLKKQLEEDTKILAKLKFDDLPTEDEWTTIQSDV